MKLPYTTPGPWRFVPCPGNAWNVSGHILADGQTMETATALCKSEGDAILISAAPDLLAALQNAANVLAALATGQISKVERDSHALLSARAAIAKATTKPRRP